MTNKAAREAFDKFCDNFPSGGFSLEDGYVAGYQAAHDAAMAAEQRPWPFVNSPQEVADKMSDAFRLFEGNMLAALRHVFIEKQEPVTARIALQAAQQREAEWVQAWRTVSQRYKIHRPPEFVALARKYEAALATQPTSSSVL